MLLHAQTLPRLMLIVAAVVLALALLLSALNAAATTAQTLLTLNVEVELLLPSLHDAEAVAETEVNAER
jgi:hypothetical protein